MEREVRAMRLDPPTQAVLRGLALYNLAYPGELGAPLNVFLRDGRGRQVHGGLLGRTGRGALAIEHLWIAEPHRKHGHGSALLVRAEAEARRRGCRFAHVDTYTFQAPAFYERNGYAPFGRLEGFTGGHARIYLRKDLEGA